MKLTFLINDNGTKRRVDVDATTIKIGTTSRAHAQFTDDLVSRLHAIVETLDGHKLQIVDLGSMSGIKLNHSPEPVRMCPIEPLDVVHVSTRSHFQILRTEMLDNPESILTREPPSRMATGPLRAEIYKLNTLLSLYDEKQFVRAVIERRRLCEKELLDGSAIIDGPVEVADHPFRPLVAEAPKAPPTKVRESVPWEVASLKGQLAAMTKDRDGWQIEAERLANVVAERDREIEALKQQIRDSKEGWRHQ